MLWGTAGLITFKQVPKEQRTGADFLTIALFPIYFWLHSYAAYMAIFELFLKPFRWNKTDHGQY